MSAADLETYCLFCRKRLSLQVDYCSSNCRYNHEHAIARKRIQRGLKVNCECCGKKIMNLSAEKFCSSTCLGATQQSNYELCIEPIETTDFEATDALPGSDEKREIIRKRLESRLPLWHPNDRTDFNGCVGGFKLRRER